MFVDFKDITKVEVKEFHMYGTYDDHLEGDYLSVTKHFLEREQSEKGLVYIKPELVEGILKPFCYSIYAYSDWEHRLKVVWHDDDIPSTMSLKDYIQKKIQNIEFQTTCLFFDLDNQ